MRKIVSGFASSLDGYIEGVNGEYDWILIDSEIDFVEQMKRFDTFLYGRKSYEKIVAMNAPAVKGTAHYVVSSTLTDVKKDFQLINNNVQIQLAEIKNGDGKDIALFGGATLLASLFDMKLVDEISVSVIPVLLGAGKPMVDVLKNKISLSLINTKAYKNGTVQLTYSVKY